MKQTLRIIILCYSFILFEGLLFPMLADTGKAEKEVLVLNSINFNLPWSKHFYWCVHDELQQRGVSVKAESLSVPALLDTMEVNAVITRLREKYPVPPAAIVLIGDPGWIVCRELFDDVWKDVPVVVTNARDRLPASVEILLSHAPLTEANSVPAKEWRRGYNITTLKQHYYIKETIELIHTIDKLYNAMVDPNFEKRYGNLETVLAVSLEELAEFSWKDYLEEEALEESFGTYLEHLNEAMTNLDKMELDQETKKEEPEEETSQKKKILVVDEEALSKMHSYVQRNYGIGYLSETEEKRRNLLLCRGIHSDCSLYFTEGVLKHAVLRNYQYEYAKKQRDKNRYEYYNNHRMVKNNIRQLSDMLKKALVMRDEVQETISDRGRIVPSRLWRVGRSHDSRVFLRKLNHDNSDFVVDVLIDASGSQRKRQGQVAMQAYILSEALSIANVPHRVMSFCTFWDYTILHRFREYEDDRSANENIFEYNTSSNNRDGLAIKAAGYELLNREEEHKILIVLSDGRPYDVILNRPNARNPQPYQGKYAISDTAFEVRKLRSKGVCVLGVFAGEEKDLPAEKKIFGKDFAYIRDVAGFSGIVGRYLLKQLEREE